MNREENYNEYLRLLQNDDYVEVTYDEASGGVSAVHKFHKFDKRPGPYGIKRGDYERIVLDVMRGLGTRIVLESEMSSPGNKMFDGYLNDIPMEIKAIEGMGVWTISTKLRAAERQHAECVVLYFPDKNLYSEDRVLDGIEKYLANPEIGKDSHIRLLLAITKEELVACWDKKATPIEGWSIWEGFRRRNGAHPFTISPSDANI